MENQNKEIPTVEYSAKELRMLGKRLLQMTSFWSVTSVFIGDQIEVKGKSGIETLFIIKVVNHKENLI